MISHLNLLCFHEYMCVLDPILQVYSHLLCVMIRQPEVTIIGTTPGGDHHGIVDGEGLCNTPDVTFHICNSNSCHFRLCVMIFPPWSGFVFILHFVHVMHLISCHIVHCICIRVRLMHLSIFPVIRFAILHSHLLRRTPLVSFRERVLNVLGMDRGLSSGLSIPPVDHRSRFVPFEGRLVLQRLTG